VRRAPKRYLLEHKTTNPQEDQDEMRYSSVETTKMPKIKNQPKTPTTDVNAVPRQWNLQKNKSPLPRPVEKGVRRSARVEGKRRRPFEIKKHECGLGALP
jgi:hypothetical protein